MENIDGCVIDNVVVQPEEASQIIKIIGVGGAGCNAVNNMYEKGIAGVNMIVCNTDAKALEHSPVRHKVQLGKMLTCGLGTGYDPEKGKQSAIEAMADIEAILHDNTRMVFVTAGMGKGTGTGAAPVIAKAAKVMGILTVGIVQIPYSREGKPKLRMAINGAIEMSKCVDPLLVVNTDRVIEMYRSEKMPLKTIYKKGDEVMCDAARSIAEMITKYHFKQIDFADVQRAMTDSGCAVMGVAEASGEGRALRAVEAALDSPLLNNNDITGATNILVNITARTEEAIGGDEYGEIMEYVYDKAGGRDNEHNLVVDGAGADETLEEGVLRVIVVATGFTTDCFDLDRKKADQVVKIPIGKTIDEVGDKEADGEGATVIEFTNPDTERTDAIIMDIYGQRSNGGKHRPVFTTLSLSDATSLPLDRLTEEELANIEKRPAYLRRANGTN